MKSNLDILNDLVSKISYQTGMSIEEISHTMGYNEGYISQIRSRKHVPDKFLNALKAKFASNGFEREDYLIASEDTPIIAKSNYLQQRQKIKTQSDPDRDGVLFVPLTAQAGYTKSYIDPVYLNQLERIYMPGFPYRGHRYRIFEVDGSSMEPTFKEGYFVVCEKVEREN